MRVLVVLPSIASLPFLKESIEALAAAGWDVHFASSGFNFERSGHAALPLTHHTLDLPRGADPRAHLGAGRALDALVGTLAPDVVDVHFSAAMLSAAVGRRRHWPTTLATVQGLRFPMQRGARRLLETRIECWSARRMDSVTVLTADDLDALRRHGVGNARLQVAKGFGCRLDVFDPRTIGPDARARARAEAGIEPGDKVFIFIGRKTRFKGYALVVRAFLAAQRELASLRLVVCGDTDPMHPSGLSAEEEALVAAHPRIATLGWRDDVRDFLAVSDVNVFPSEREGMPVNLMESLAMGVPVITSDARGCRDIVEHGVTGVVLGERSERALAREMLALARDDARRGTLSANALAGRSAWDRQRFVAERLERLERGADARARR